MTTPSSDSVKKARMKCGHEKRAMDSIYTCADCFDSIDKRIVELEAELKLYDARFCHLDQDLEATRAELKEAREELITCQRIILDDFKYSKLRAEIERKDQMLRTVHLFLFNERWERSNIKALHQLGKDVLEALSKPKEES